MRERGWTGGTTPPTTGGPPFQQPTPGRSLDHPRLGESLLPSIQMGPVNHFLSPEHRPFDLFGPIHLTTMVLIAVVGWWIVNSAMAGGGARRRYRVGMTATLILVDVTNNLWGVLTGMWTVRTELPLHLCGIMVWVSVVGLWIRRRWAYTLMYFFGVAGAVQAVITPAADFGALHLKYVTTMSSHGLLVIAGLWVVLVERYRPTMRDLVGAFVILNCYAVFLYPLNRLLGSNYMYVLDKPATASLLDVFPPWPWYIALTELVAFALFVIMYLPFRKGSPVP